MTYKDFWYGDPWMVRAFAQAYLLKRKVDNENAWIYGAYFHAALNASLSTAFGKRADYLKQPVDFFPKTKVEKEVEQKEQKRKLIEYFNKLASRKKKMGSGSDGEP